MSSPDPSRDTDRDTDGDTDRDDAPPSWMGGPGYTPVPETLMPHAPLPGAPPYPPNAAPPGAPVGAPPRGTPFRRALAATAIWAVAALLLVAAVSGPVPSAGALGVLVGQLAVAALFAATVTWLFAQRGSWSFLTVLLVSLPIFVLAQVPAAVFGG